MKQITIPPSTTKFHFPFMQFRNYFMVLSLVFVILGVYAMVNKGFNYGIDFMGGVKLVYKFSNPIGDSDIRRALEKINLADAEVVRFGDAKDNSYLIKVRTLENKDTAKEVTDKLTQELSTQKITLLSEETVGPKVGAELRQKGLMAVVLSLALILVYIGWRFDFLFSPGAIAALAHDTIFALGLFVFLGKEFNLTILTAVLTLIGYSNNDTIIIYDRVRENLKKLPAGVPLVDIIDRSLNETLSRSIITHLTVLFSMIVLFIFGGGVIHDFAFFMIIGVIVGSYSSMFIASPIYLWMQKLFPHKGLLADASRYKK
ncbi:protein translocase subunit SecF [bacterium]|nr:protein translocase subunit SecF [bacterium]